MASCTFVNNSATIIDTERLQFYAPIVRDQVFGTRICWRLIFDIKTKGYVLVMVLYIFLNLICNYSSNIKCLIPFG